MIRRLAKKILQKMGLLNRLRAPRYEELTKFLGIKDGFVYLTEQVVFDGKKLIATGEDPQILIEFKNKTKSLKIECEVDGDDQIELFSSDDGVSFVAEDMEIVNNGGSSEIVPFKRAGKFFRLDLAKSEGEIRLKKMQILPDKFRGDKVDLMLKRIPRSESGNGYVIVTHAMDGTGAPLLAYSITKTLKERGENIVVIALRGGFLAKKYRELKIPVFDFYQDAREDRILRGKEFERVVKTLREKGYDRALLNTTISGIAAPYFKNHNYKVMTLIHEMKNSIVRYGMEDGGRNANFYSDYIVFPDEIVKKEFASVFEKTDYQAIVLPQGLYKKYKENTPNRVLISKKYAIPQNAKIVLGSGAADFRKGADLFFAAALELIKKEGEDEYHFVWTGEFPDKNLKNWFSYQFEKMGLKSRIHNVSFIKDPREYQNLVECADVFWLTSREDPFPSVMIEALQYNTPVIAFKGCGGADTLLAEGRGILVENFDVEKLALETINLTDAPEKAKKMLEKAQKYIQDNLDFERYIDRLVEHFDEKEKAKFTDLTAVIPNYNYANYLPIRINTILNQTVKPKEIIFLDDNSTDNSAEVVKPLLEAAKENYGIQYKIIENNDNQGCFKQWVKGIKQAKYDFVWIAEADDYIKPTFVEKMMPAFRDKAVNLAYAKSCVIDGESMAVDYDYNSYLEDLDEQKWKKDFVCDGKEFVTKYLSQKNVIPNASSTIIRKSATEGIEKFLSEYQAIGDWFAYIYMIGQGKVSYRAEVLNGHRRHGKSIIAKQEKSLNFAKEIIMIKKYLLENFEFDEKNLNKMMVSTLNENFDVKLLDENEDLRKNFEKLKEIYNKKKRRENLVVVVPDLEAGGGQTVGVRFANAFSEYYNVFLVNAREPLEVNYMKKMISPDVEVLKCNGDPEKLKWFGLMLDAKAAISLIWWSDKLSYLAFRDTEIKRIISMHGCYEKILDHPEIDPFYDENVEDMLKTASHVVYTAEKNRRVFKEKQIEIGDRLSKIDNGFLLGDYPKKRREELGISKDDFVFGLVARGIPEKGYEQAIKGVKHVNETLDKNCHLILVGSGEYIEELEKKYQSRYIHFINNTTEPLEWIGWEETFDVGLLPSYFESESLPTVIIEMLFLGKPVIATDIGEIKSMLTDGDTRAGVVIPLKNKLPDQEALNAAMLEVVTRPETLKELKKNTKMMSERFDIDKCITKYRKLIDD